MIEVPVPEPPSPREEVIEILAEGLWELVVRGRRPDRPRELREAASGVQARPVNQAPGETSPATQSCVPNR
jgi:hypothetical protein